MPRLEKFFEKSYLALSSWNRIWEGVGSKEDAPERRGFRDRVDFRLGAIEQLIKRKREGEREMQKSTNHNQYIRI